MKADDLTLPTYWIEIIIDMHYDTVYIFRIPHRAWDHFNLGKKMWGLFQTSGGLGFLTIIIPKTDWNSPNLWPDSLPFIQPARVRPFIYPDLFRYSLVVKKSRSRTFAPRFFKCSGAGGRVEFIFFYLKY